MRPVRHPLHHLIRASIVPPPFGSGYGGKPRYNIERDGELQSCRPLSGAVMLVTARSALGSIVLQSCRPLSGAVISINTALDYRQAGFNRAAPFRERLFESTPDAANAVYELQSCRPLSGAVMSAADTCTAPPTTASIVPPPFGSGYGYGHPTPWAGTLCFNRAAPFRERLSP